MKSPIKLLMLFIVTVPFYAAAQSNYRPGYAVTLNGDTLKGYIDYREWDNNPDDFKFKADPDATTQTFTTANTSAFGINGIDYFEKHLVSISMDKVILAEISTGIDTTKRQDIVFLKILAKGKNINLYRYIDQLKTRYYYSETGVNGINEITHYVFHPLDDPNHVMETNGEIQLNYLVNKYNPAFSGKVNNIKYGDEDMLKIAGIINGNDNTQFKAPSKTSTNFYAGIGGAYSILKFNQIAYISNPGKSNDYLLPYINAGIEIYPNKNTQKLLFKVELNLSSLKHDQSQVTHEYFTTTSTQLNIQQYTIALSPQIIYNFYSKQKLKIFAGAGASVNLSLYHQKYTSVFNDGYNDITDYSRTDFPKLDGVWISVPVTAGVTINNRISIDLYYYIASTITTFGGTGSEITSYRAGISYLFGHK